MPSFSKLLREGSRWLLHWPSAIYIRRSLFLRFPSSCSTWRSQISFLAHSKGATYSGSVLLSVTHFSKAFLCYIWTEPWNTVTPVCHLHQVTHSLSQLASTYAWIYVFSPVSNLRVDALAMLRYFTTSIAAFYASSMDFRNALPTYTWKQLYLTSVRSNVELITVQLPVGGMIRHHLPSLPY